MIKKLPGYGFFGGTEDDALSINISSKIKKLRVEIVNGKKEILNLKGLKLIPDDFVKLGSYICRQSSFYEPEKKAIDLLKFKGMHTEREINPFWEIYLDHPVSIKKILLANRPDKWSKRSRDIVISILDDSNSYQTIYAGGQSLEDYVFIDFLHNNNICNAYEFENMDIKEISRKIADKVYNNNSLPFDFYANAIKVIDIWGKNALDDSEETILAGYLLKAYENVGESRAIRPFSEKLFTAKLLDSLDYKIKKVCSSWGVCEKGITRHGLHDYNMLGKDKESNLQFLHTIFTQFSELGYTMVLAYGTLLGAKRSGSFLKHDDDIDCLFLASSLDEKSLIVELKELIKLLKEKGYKIEASLKRRYNFHIIDPETGCMIDAFPYWKSQDGSEVFLHMEKMKVRSIPSSIMMPSSSVLLENKSFPAPNKIEEFLVERYGDSWHVEQKYFNWSWKLEE